MHAMWDAHGPHCESSHHVEDYCANCVFAEADGECDKRGRADECHIDQEADCKNAFYPWPTQDATVVDNVEHVGVVAPILNKVVRRVKTEHTHTDDAQYTWEEAEDVKSRRKRQHTNTNFVRNKDYHRLCSRKFVRRQ